MPITAQFTDVGGVERDGGDVGKEEVMNRRRAEAERRPQIPRPKMRSNDLLTMEMTGEHRQADVME